jgi:ribosomal protein S18 acetylase RimI-like enzyme
VRVWRAEPEEAPDVATLLIAFRDHLGRDWPDDASILASVRRLIARDDSEFLLAAEAADAPPAGVCQLRYRHTVWFGTDDCWLEDLYVHEQVRRAGAGRALVEAAMARASERGCRRIGLDCSDDNAGALALYADLGFTTGWKAGVKDLYLHARLDE